MDKLGRCHVIQGRGQLMQLLPQNGIWAYVFMSAFRQDANYKVIVKDLYGCADTETVYVRENTLTPPKLSPDEVFLCDGVNIMLYCSPEDLRYKYEWFFNSIDMGIDTTFNKTPINKAGLYNVRVTDFYNCVLTTNTVKINTYPAVIKPIITAFGAYGNKTGQSSAGMASGTIFIAIPLKAGTISANKSLTPESRT